MLMASFGAILKQNVGTVVLACALSASLGLNVYQGLKQRGAFAPPTGVQPGATFPTQFSVLDENGNPAAFSFAADVRPTVMYVLSPLCGWCKKNEGNIKALVTEAGTRFRFVGLSTEPKNLKEYVAQNHAPFPVYLVSSQDEVQRLHLGGTPQTIVVNRRGKVQKAWQGAYAENIQREIERYFGVKLPGLQDAITAVDETPKIAVPAN
jgi:hypothetical protein